MRPTSRALAATLLLAPFAAQADVITFQSNRTVALVHDAEPEQSTENCAAPFSPIRVELHPDMTRGFRASSTFFDGLGNQPAYEPLPGEGISILFSETLFVMPPPGSDVAIRRSADLEEIGTNRLLRNSIIGPPLAFDIVLTGCGFGSQLDIVDGTLRITGEVGNYQIDVEETISDLWDIPNAASRARFTSVFWDDNPANQGRTPWRYDPPGSPHGYEEADILGNLILDFWFPYAVPHQITNNSIRTNFTLNFNAIVVDQRDQPFPQQVASTPSLFTSVTPLTDR